MKKRINFILLVLLAAIGLPAGLYAQPTASKSGGNTISYQPLYSWYPSYHHQYLYTPADLQGALYGNITKIYFRPGLTGTSTYSSFVISLGQTTATNYSGSPAPFVTSLSTVLSASTYTMTGTTGQWLEISLNTPFAYDASKSLVVDISWASVTSGTGFTVYGSNNQKSIYYWDPYSTVGYNIGHQMDFGVKIVGNPPVPPAANFYTPGTACQGSTVNFVNNTVTFPPTTYRWTINPSTFNYVDGTDRFSKVPAIQFLDTGVYTVRLSATNNIGADSITKTIRIDTATVAPIANLMTSKLVIPKAAALTRFTDLSTNCPQTWEWSSPDYLAETGFDAFLNPNARNPDAFFAIAGVFDVCLKVTNNVGSHTLCRSDYMNVVELAAMCVDTVSNKTSGYLVDEGNLNLNYYNNRNDNNCKGFLIDPCAGTVTLDFEMIKLFSATGGDSIYVHNGPNKNSPIIFRCGSNMNGLTPSVTASSGKMFIRFNTDASGNSDGFLARWSSTPATYGKPIAGFKIPNVNGFKSDTVYSGYKMVMINTTTGVDPTYNWDLSGSSSTLATPSVTFFNFTSTPETKVITLIAKNCKGSDTLVKTVVVMPVNGIPSPVNFVANRLSVAPGDTVTFTNLTVGATAWEWTFSPNVVSYLNGTNKNSEHPVVFVIGNGCIDVKLKAMNSSGMDSIKKNCYLKAITYCAPGVITLLNSDVGISRVQLNTINNTSVSGANAYENYYDSTFGSTTLYRGVSYTLTISRPTNTDPVSRKAWIDFNIDGDFDDAGETIASESSSNNLTSSFTFSIPANSKYGISRLRVGTTYSNTSPLVPCATFMGEFEEYRINLYPDDQKPVITMIGADTLFIEVNKPYVDPGASAMDNLEGDITSKLVFTNDIDTTKVGFYQACYDVQDMYGNQAVRKCRTVSVKVDLTPPDMTLNGTDPMYVEVYSSFVDPGVNAIDNYSGNLNAHVVKAGTVDTATVGNYTVSYTVRDYFGYLAAKTRTVIVRDTTRPVIQPIATTTFTHSIHLPLNDQLVVNVLDNYYKNITPVRTGAVDVNTLGSYTVTYNATDGSGNTATPVSVTIVVADTTAPSISLNSADTVVLEVFSSYSEPVPVVTDNHYTGITATKLGSVDKKKLGDYTLTYTAIDGSLNTAVKTVVVRVVDTQKPVMTVKEGDIVNWPLGKPWVDPGVKIVDNYYDELVLTPLLVKKGTVNTNLAGFYYIKYNVTDPSGNVADEIMRTVRVLITGVDEVKNSLIRVYPNPASTWVKLDLTRLPEADVQVKVMNVLGAEVLSTGLKGGANQELDLSTLPAGNYFIQVQGGAELYTQKLLIAR